MHSYSDDYSKGEKFKYVGTLKPPSSLSNVKITLHEHDAEKAGKHYDLRIGGAGDWAIRYFPTNPSESRLAIQQPIHPISYYSFEGDITEGYGKGSVKKVFEGYGTVHSWTKDKIDFSFDNKNYVLINTGNGKWLIRMKKQDLYKASANLNMKSVLDRDTFEKALCSEGFSEAMSGRRRTGRKPLEVPVGARGMALRANDPNNVEWPDPKKGMALRTDLIDEKYY